MGREFYKSCNKDGLEIFQFKWSLNGDGPTKQDGRTGQGRAGITSRGEMNPYG